MVGLYHWDAATLQGVGQKMTCHQAQPVLSPPYRQNCGLDRVERKFYGDALVSSLADKKTAGSLGFDLSKYCDGTKRAGSPMKFRNHDELHPREQIGSKAEADRRNEISNLTGDEREKDAVASQQCFESFVGDPQKDSHMKQNVVGNLMIDCVQWRVR